MARILVLESSLPQQKIILNCLLALGFSDIVLRSRTEDVHPDELDNTKVIILDNNFGKYHKKGIQFMYEIKDTCPDTKFFFYSSDANIDAAMCALRLGARKYTQKGLPGLQELVTSVARYLERERHLHCC